MTMNKGDGPCGSNPDLTRDSNSLKVRNRVAETLSDPRFRLRRTRDRTKEHPRNLKHKEIIDD